MPFAFVDEQPSPPTGGFVFLDEQPQEGKIDLPGWEEPKGTVANLLRGIGETGLTMAGRGFQFVGRGLESIGATDLGEAAKEKGEELATTGLGFREPNPAAMEQAWEEGDYWTAAKEAFKFGGTSAVSSLPWSALAIAGAPGFAAAGLLLIEDIAQERARNDGRDEAEWGDFAKATPPGLASTMLDRIGLKGILSAGRAKGVSEKTLNAFAEYAKAVGKETATEAVQEPIEYFGETAGTQVGFQPMEAAKRSLYGALGGAVGGAGFGAVSTPINRALERRQALGELPEDIPELTNVGPEQPEAPVVPPIATPPSPPAVEPADPLAEAVAKSKQRLMNLEIALAERGADPVVVSQLIPEAKQLPMMGLQQDPGLKQWGNESQLTALLDSVNGQRFTPQAGRNQQNMYRSVEAFIQRVDSTFNADGQSKLMAAINSGEQDPKVLEGLLQAERPDILDKFRRGGSDMFARMLTARSVMEEKWALKPGDVATVAAYRWRDAVQDKAWLSKQGRMAQKKILGLAKREAQEVEAVIEQTKQFVKKYMPGAAVVLDFRVSSKTGRFGEHGMLGDGTMVSMIRVNKGDTIALESVSGRYAPPPGADLAKWWNKSNRLQFKLRLMENLSHELGHALVSHEFTLAPNYVQRAIMAEYQLWLEERAKGSVGELVRDSYAIGWQGLENSQQPLSQHQKFTYLLSFEEYMARRVADYATGRLLFEDAKGLAGFWRRVVGKLRALYQSLVKPLDPESSFVKWMETLSLKGEIDAMEEVQKEQHRQRLAKAKEAPTSGSTVEQPLPDNVTRAFTQLGDAQRGQPEIAMVQAQRALGGGVLSSAIEHTGDLTHRMTHMLGWTTPSAGYAYVKDKVERVLGMLTQEYGFAREAEGNLRNNAEFAKVPLEQFKARADAALGQYTAAHRSLPVYNRMQWLAREAAIQLGEQNFAAAARHLQELQSNLDSSNQWFAKATEYTLNSAGEPAQYRPTYRNVQAGLSSSSSTDVRAAINKVFDKLQLRGLDEKRISKNLARFNKVMKFALTLPQIERENWGVPGMRGFTDGMRAFWAEKAKWAEQWDKWLEQANTLSKGQQQKIWEFANNVTLRSDKLERKLTPAEIAEEAQKVGGLSTEQLELWKTGRKILTEAFEANFEVEKQLLTKEWGEKDPIMLKAQMVQLEQEHSAMVNRDYWPLSRFGRFAVYVKMKAGKQAVYEGKTFKGGQTVLFELYETDTAQLARKFALIKALGADNVEVAADTVDESLFAFMGMPPSMLRRIEKEMLAAAADYQMGTDPDQDQMIQDLLRDQLRALRLARLEMSPEHSFAQRMQRRKGVKGFNENGLRSMAYWGRSFSNHIARVKWKPEMDDALSVMAKHKYDISRTEDPGLYDQGNVVGDLLNHLRQHQHEVLYPGNDWANLRALGFMWYLGFVPRAALVQPFQILTTTGPWLGSRFGDAKAAAQLVKTATMLRTLARKGSRVKLRPDEQMALQAGYDAGFINEGLFTELGGVAEGSNLQRILPGKFLKSETAAHEIRKWGYRSSYMFQKMEEFNRLITFHAAYNLAIEKALRELGRKGTMEEELANMAPEELEALRGRAVELGRQAVETTQGEYARWARPRAAWGKMSALLMFKMYPQFMTYFTLRDPGRWRFLAMQLMLAGALGLPFADDLLDVFTLLLNKLGMNTGDLRDDLRRVLAEMDMNPDLIMHGTARYGFGAGVDLSSSLSLGRIVPGVDPLTNAMMPGGNLGDQALRVQNEALGALFSLPVNIVNALSTGRERDWEKASPTVLRDAYRAYRRVRDEGELDRSGAKIADMDLSKWDHVWETTAQALGMRATRIAQRADLNWAQKQAEMYWDARRAQIVNQFVQLRQQGWEDREAIADWQDALHEFNNAVPNGALKLSAKALIQSAKRKEKNRALREQGLPTAKKYRGLYEEIEMGYPDAATVD